MTLVTLAAAAALALPMPAKDWQASIPDDVPETTAAVTVQIVVDPTGKAVSCIRTATYGDPKLAALLCKILGGGAYKPAQNKDGKPTWGVIRTVLSSGTAPFNASQFKTEPDFERVVPALPKDGKKPIDVEVIVQVDGGGRVVACQLRKTRKDWVAFAERACADAVDFNVPTPKAGNLEGYVTNLKVRYRL